MKNHLINFKVVTLCGSTRFKKEYEQATIELTLLGHIVLACPIFHHADNLVLDDCKTQTLSLMHQQRIEMASEIYVVNKDGYIGESTKREIEYTKSLGKQIHYLFPNI